MNFHYCCFVTFMGDGGYGLKPSFKIYDLYIM